MKILHHFLKNLTLTSMKLYACGAVFGDPASRALRNVSPLHIVRLSRRFVGESVHRFVIPLMMEELDICPVLR